MTNQPPAYTITLSGNVTYGQFKKSLGSYVYFINQLYLYSINLKQIQGSFYYYKYDSNGDANAQSVVSAISPYQYENSIYLSVEEKNLILDGRDFVKLNLEPNTILQAKLYCDMISDGTDLDDKGINNFIDYMRSSGETDFFKEYQGIL